MFSRQSLLALLSLSGSPVLADFLGPRYPPPADLTSKVSHVVAGWENLTETLQGYLKISPEEDPVLGTLKNTTFSVGLFSTRDDGAASKFQLHHNSPTTKGAKYGTKKVDGDTIYGIASITKLFTVYSALMNLDPTDWERPLTYFFPQLADTAQEPKDNPAEHIQWDKITPLALANQISGVPRDGWPLFTTGEKLVGDTAAALGLPPLNMQKDPQLSTMPCSNFSDPNITSCADDYDNYVESQENRPPTFLPWANPAYANTGFIILGAVLQNLTGKSLDEQFSSDIFDPLGMSRTYTEAPPKDKWDNAVIPVNNDTELELMYLLTPDPAKSSGTLLSTLNDLTKFGSSILNYTLLPGDVTRKWMKPHTHTARLDYSVGGPWEIPRYVHPETGLVIDLYTKSGDAGLFSSFLVLVPEFKIGFSVLAASSDRALRALVAGKIGDAVVNAIMPALLKQADTEAEKNYGGTYVSTTEGLNSSITITRNKTEGAPPGLTISRFISNSTDYLLAEAEASGAPNDPDAMPNRLVPTVVGEKSGRVAMRALTAMDAPKLSKGTISGILSADWTTVGGATYGALDMGLYIFDVDDNGKATEVSPLAFRTTLKRKD
ncbi:Beta-lactamase domain-containing protein [Fusarium falciforme]|uniref:Beta-lactamase domain-containing protein n=1 Tax=Fusarium falciforme TaxID=195108 RepID=UPI00230080C9|nr:Beta-lactamase domain-containing protein [Fusarium falciforme]WAO85841.1 Beta-lactamase domain-containing protein [Fusarium falciforme]